MSKSYDIAGFRAAIGDIKCEDNPTLVKQKSRDFYWYSPVLKRQLEDVSADLMVSPRSEDEVRRVALPTGLVDVKVCAVDATWSGLKLMIRRDLR